MSEVTNKVTIQSLHAMVEQQAARIAALEAQVNRPKNSASAREMTEEDAHKILTGELKDASHKDAAAKLELSYGQIYSCRLEYTFKGVHKQMRENGVANPWKKN